MLFGGWVGVVFSFLFFFIFFIYVGCSCNNSASNFFPPWWRTKWEQWAAVACGCCVCA
jgi:Na+-transporting methylmalonyl-CoA/oxaloacetate decarboxylase gamma subunit